MTISFGARRQAPVEYRSRSRGGPVTAYAQALHAALYGFPVHKETPPAALDALLQATREASTPEQKATILRQVSEQLRNAAAIIKRYQYQAQWDRSPADIAEQFADAHDQVLHAAQALDRSAPALNDRPITRTGPNAPSLSGINAAPAPPPPEFRRRPACTHHDP